MKNLKWIRPPTWDAMPEDMESFFKQDPKHTPEFATKADMYEKHEREPVEDHEDGQYYDAETDHRYIYPERFDHYDRSERDPYEREYRRDHRANDDNDEQYSRPSRSRKPKKMRSSYNPNPYPGMPMPR